MTSVRNRTSSTTPGNHTTAATYDPAGEPMTATDAMGRMTQQVEPVSDGRAITTRFGYDAVGNRTRIQHQYY
ncbi:hypothetical protein N4G70_26455 [Streptomyces sp. ASQP_92]|uniref:hypothetical protein n=1 Tax=Streptomyces sp. ASQP_92 TaxID=2979116 RepID=UPI0021BFED38|nr:hypothetical protein [Streptomyces sp. ASQP_92]MCT9092385.1 hypothetical protein [Streptomyces sp. ASQP_92]